MPNPSEMERLDQERMYYRGVATDLRFGKSTRETALAEMRTRERQLGMEPEDVVHGPGKEAPSYG